MLYRQCQRTMLAGVVNKYNAFPENVAKIAAMDAELLVFQVTIILFCWIEQTENIKSMLYVVDAVIKIINNKRNAKIN